MAYKAVHECPLHSGVLCNIVLTFVSTTGDLVLCSTCERCSQHGHPNPTNWIVVEVEPEELVLFLDTAQPELREFYIKSAVTITETSDE